MTKNYVITIGRQLGAGGSNLGKAIAEHFGFQYIDKEFLVLAAKELDVSQENIEMMDEKPEPYWINMVNTAMSEIPYTGAAWHVPTGKEVYAQQSEIMRKAAEAGPCVVIGRCGSEIFRGEEKHVSIFLHGDMASRTARLAATLGRDVKPGKDSRLIEKEDKEREKYFHNYTGKNWLDLTGYDFALDTSAFDDEQIKGLVIGYIEARFPDLKK